jgi:hypothetical protein
VTIAERSWERSKWGHARIRSCQERNILTKNFGDGVMVRLVKDNTFSKNNGNSVRYWGKPYDTM